MPPPTPPTESGAAPSTRERILDIALDLFVRKGYTETSLREIAAELGFSKAALYYHFESKQDILGALHMRMHGLSDSLLPLLTEVGGDDSWERLIDRLIGFALQNRRLIELQLRNREAIADLHTEEALKKHGARQHRDDDLQRHFQALLRDPSMPTERRVRMVASLGAVAGVLFGASAFADVPDAELLTALRDVVHDVLGSHSRNR